MAKQKVYVLNVLNNVLKTGLKLLHPVMPFITEEIYTHLDNEFESITIAKWPEYVEILKMKKLKNA